DGEPGRGDERADRGADAVGPVLGPLGQDPDPGPVGVAPGMAGAGADARLVHAVEHEHDLDVREVGEPERGVGVDHPAVELDAGALVAPVVALRRGPPAAHATDRPDRELVHHAVSSRTTTPSHAPSPSRAVTRLPSRSRSVAITTTPSTPSRCAAASLQF